MTRAWCIGVLLVLGATRGVAGSELGGEALARRVDTLAAPAGGRVGVAAMVIDGGLSFSRDGSGRYPMQSVYKLPIAMAVLARVDAGELELARIVRVEPAEFVSDAQHSRLRDRYPEGAELALEELLGLAVAESDGTASDVLLRLLGGAESVMTYLHDLCIDGIQVLDTEKAIGSDDAVQYRNWASPEASVALLVVLHRGRTLSMESRGRLLRWMTETGTGRNRLKALMPPGTSVAHKTGTSGTRDGVTAATNDIGLISLPGGRTLAIAIYVADSPAGEATRERAIAEIARSVWDVAAATGPASPARDG